MPIEPGKAGVVFPGSGFQEISLVNLVWNILEIDKEDVDINENTKLVGGISILCFFV